MHKACSVIVQFGDTKNFDEALNLNEIKLGYPYHVLDEDMDEVIKAMNTLSNDHKKSN